MRSTTDPWILGLNASHNGAACLLRGEQLVVAIQEERLSGEKRARLFGGRPSLAIDYCLDYAGIQANALDLVVLCAQAGARLPENEIAENPMLDVDAPILTLPHHLGHTISGFATSAFDEAAALIVDGMGSPFEDLFEEERLAVIDEVANGKETISLYHASQTSLTPLEKHLVANSRWKYELSSGSGMPGFGSLGGLYSAVAQQIFGEPMDAGKVMGLAPYGTPVFPLSDFFDIHDGRFVFHDDVPKRFCHARRWPDLKREYENLAASAQAALEEALLYLACRLRQRCPSENLVYSGGVALNSVANERIIREAGYRDVYIFPAAEDSGAAVGAAYYGFWKLTGRWPNRRLTSDSMGRIYERSEIAATIESTPYIERVDSANYLEDVADLLTDGSIVGWFSGGSELGPRALGQRSILCDPRQPDAKNVLNKQIKHREAFRPFAPVVLLQEVERWFEVDGVDPASPFMLRVMKFKADRVSQVPAVVHVDGTGRVQTVTKELNPSYYELLRHFYDKTGVPILLNTSFNLMGEPIVETPEDALWCMLMTGMDSCVVEGVIVTKKNGYGGVRDLRPLLLVDAESIIRDNGNLLFETRTPWGNSSFPRFGFEPEELPLVENLIRLVDGRRMAGDVLDHVSASGPVPVGTAIRLMARLRRARVLTFRESIRDS